MPESLNTRENQPSFPGNVTSEPIKFLHYLEAQERGAPSKRSGKRTRLKFMVATTELLEEHIFTELNVIDICRKADLAKGTFYLQFEAKEDVILAIFRDFMDFEVRTMPVRNVKRTTFQEICSIVSWYERSFRVNAGIMRSFVRMSDLDEGVSELWKRRNEQVVERGLGLYLENSNFKRQDQDLAIMALRTLGGIMDYAMFARHGIHQASDFTSNFSEDMLIELHALILFRALYGEDPESPEVSPTMQRYLRGAREKR